jgi:hypothetical protein
MLIKDTAAGVIQKGESFDALYATDNQGYASPPTSTEWPRLRTLTGADISDVVSAVNGYGCTAAGGQTISTRFMNLTVQGATLVAVVATATTPQSVTMSTSTTAARTCGCNDTIIGSRTLGILKSVKYAIRLQQTTNMRIWIGVSSSTTAATFQSDTPSANFCGFRYSTAAGDTKYQCVTQTASGSSTKTAESTASHVDTNAHIFELQFDGTNVVFLIDGVQVGSQSGNTPATSVALAHIVLLDNVGLGNNKAMDFFSLNGADFPTG